MKEYLKIFIDDEYPDFIDKYLDTNTMKRLKNITQFCGCDYTKLYSPLFKYSRYDHSLVVAHMTWHFTHDKEETIMALLHDVGTPCFAHCIDYVFNDYLKQESSEKSIKDIIKSDSKMQELLKQDNIDIKIFDKYKDFHILENKSPRLCVDRLDGVLHTCYIWLKTHSLKDIKEVYDDIMVLTNEDGNPEIGFNSLVIGEKFVTMVYTYAIELQSNTDKFVSMFIADMVKLSFANDILSLNDLYEKKEEEICQIFNDNFSAWNKFTKASKLIKTNKMPTNKYYISYETKKRNTIPLVIYNNEIKRIDLVSKFAKEKYKVLKLYKDSKYAYIKEIDELK